METSAGNRKGVHLSEAVEIVTVVAVRSLVHRIRLEKSLEKKVAHGFVDKIFKEAKESNKRHSRKMERAP